MFQNSSAIKFGFSRQIFIHFHLPFARLTYLNRFSLFMYFITNSLDKRNNSIIIHRSKDQTYQRF